MKQNNSSTEPYKSGYGKSWGKKHSRVMRRQRQGMLWSLLCGMFLPTGWHEHKDVKEERKRGSNTDI